MTNTNAANLGRMKAGLDRDTEHQVSVEDQALAAISRRTVLEGSKTSLGATRTRVEPSWTATWAFPAYSGLAEIV